MCQHKPRANKHVFPLQFNSETSPLIGCSRVCFWDIGRAWQGREQVHGHRFWMTFHSGFSIITWVPFRQQLQKTKGKFYPGRKAAKWLSPNRQIYDFFFLLACFIFPLLSFPLLSVLIYNKKIKRKTFLRKKPNVYVEISNLFLMNQLAMNNIKSIYKDLKKIKNKIIYKDLMYSTWKSTQHHVAVWTGGQFGGGRILAYIWLSPFAVRLKSPQDC